MRRDIANHRRTYECTQSHKLIITFFQVYICCDDDDVLSATVMNLRQNLSGLLSFVNYSLVTYKCVLID